MEFNNEYDLMNFPRTYSCGCMGNSMFIFISSSTRKLTNILSRCFTRFSFWFWTWLWSFIWWIFCFLFRYVLLKINSFLKLFHRYRYNISRLWNHMLNFSGYIYFFQSTFTTRRSHQWSTWKFICR